MRPLSLLVTLALLAPACTPADPAADLDGDNDGDTLGGDDKADRTAPAATATFFAVARDGRGGYTVQRIGRAKTPCADGTSADRCPVGEIDLSRVGLAGDEGSRLLEQPAELVVRGNLARVSARSAAVLIVTEAYRSTAPAPVTSTMYELADNGVRCIAAPCFTMSLTKLSSTVLVTLSGVDGALAGAVTNELAVAPVLVTGSWRTVSGGRVLTPAQVWTRVEAADPAACRAAADCTATAYSRFVASPVDCYCPTCEDAVVSGATADANRASWERHCAGVRLACSGSACVAAPAAACVAGSCRVAD